ncbi:MAG TPA: toprim domain-containing protein, partial [Geminicoccus sp.]|uniref:DUF7146 domain-containing protein n=1 Tax=Geminicoccus sp. TaxID=2024832 RepID=UPI002E366CCD
MSGQIGPDDDLNELRAALINRTEDLAVHLLGQRSGHTSTGWRWGSKGSLDVVLRGPKRGLWYDHEAGEGGDLLKLIRREQGGSFAETAEWARSFIGTSQQHRPKRERIQPAPKQELEEARRIGHAHRLWAESVPVTDTLAEHYLTDTRAIPRPAAGWPAAIRFHPAHKALILAATDDTGDVQAVQLVYLTDEARKRPRDDGQLDKRTFGVLAGAAVRLPGDTSSLLLAEGPETGLSVWAATGRETRIALGGITKIDPPPLRRLVACADDDPRDAPAAKSFYKAVARWRRDGWAVAVATPWRRRRFDKSDFNDLIRKEGPDGIRARIEAALSPPGVQVPNDALSIDLARLKVEKAVRGFFAQVNDFDPDAEDGLPPIVHGIKVGVGIGKSEAALRESAQWLALARRRGDTRNIGFAIPMHSLANEQVRRFMTMPEAQRAGLTAAVWRGREAADPGQDGKAMCHDLEAVREVQAALGNVDTQVCGSKQEGPRCPFFEVCGYQRQKKQQADLWFFAHELLFTEKPGALGELAAVVVDEAAWAKGLEGVSGPPINLPLSALDPMVTLIGKGTGPIDIDRLRYIHGRVTEILATMKDGPLSRSLLLEAGLTTETGRDGRSLSLLRIVKPDVVPGMPPALRREATMACIAENRTVLRLAHFFEALTSLLAEDGPDASGWASLATVDMGNGPVRVLRLRRRRAVRKDWQRPTLHMDALLDPVLLRPYWPNIEVTVKVEARTPHARFRQLIGRDWPKSALVPDEGQDPAENERRRKNNERLRAAVWREARRHRGRVLLIVYKAVEEYWRTCGPIPANVELAHHNAIAGRDEWGPGPGRAGVELVVVIGRTEPSPDVVERMAETLTGAAITERTSRYDRQDAPINHIDGTASTTEASVHPHAMAEAVRWQICEGELVQGIGRCRAVSRTNANPVEVLILTNRPLPLPIDATVTWEELAPSMVDMMLGQGGVALMDLADASRCYPKLWPSPEAARKAAERERCVTF